MIPFKKLGKREVFFVGGIISLAILFMYLNWHFKKIVRRNDDGFSYVELYNPIRNLHGILNMRGDTIVPPIYNSLSIDVNKEAITPFIKAYLKNEGVTLYDTNGRVVVLNASYVMIWNRLIVCSKDNACEAISESGDVLVSKEDGYEAFVSPKYFRDNYEQVYNNSFFFGDKIRTNTVTVFNIQSGEVIVSECNSVAGESDLDLFSYIYLVYGLLEVDGVCGYKAVCSTNGNKCIIPYSRKYTDIWIARGCVPEESIYILVRRNGTGWGVCDTAGNELVEPTYGKYEDADAIGYRNGFYYYDSDEKKEIFMGVYLDENNIGYTRSSNSFGWFSPTHQFTTPTYYVPQYQQPIQYQEPPQPQYQHQQQLRDCGVCWGTGNCSTCGGSGRVYNLGFASGEHECVNCRGSGRCQWCGGTGKIN